VRIAAALRRKIEIVTPRKSFSRVAAALPTAANFRLRAPPCIAALITTLCAFSITLAR